MHEILRGFTKTVTNFVMFVDSSRYSMALSSLNQLNFIRVDSHLAGIDFKFVLISTQVGVTKLKWSRDANYAIVGNGTLDIRPVIKCVQSRTSSNLIHWMVLISSCIELN